MPRSMKFPYAITISVSFFISWKSLFAILKISKMSNTLDTKFPDALFV